MGMLEDDMESGQARTNATRLRNGRENLSGALPPEAPWDAKPIGAVAAGIVDRIAATQPRTDRRDPSALNVGDPPYSTADQVRMALDEAAREAWQRGGEDWAVKALRDVVQHASNATLDNLRRLLKV